jgi:hypothetical protein
MSIVNNKMTVQNLRADEPVPCELLFLEEMDEFFHYIENFKIKLGWSGVL